MIQRSMKGFTLRSVRAIVAASSFTIIESVKTSLLSFFLIVPQRDCPRQSASTFRSLLLRLILFLPCALASG